MTPFELADEALRLATEKTRNADGSPNEVMMVLVLLQSQLSVLVRELSGGEDDEVCTYWQAVIDQIKVDLPEVS